MRLGAFAAVVVLAVGIVPVIAAGGRSATAEETVTPAVVDTALAPGESLTVDKTVRTPVVPPRPDVVLLVDGTGSMGPAIADVQDDLDRITGRVRAQQPDSRFAVATFGDQEVDGAGVFTVLQGLTADLEAVQDGVDRLDDTRGSNSPGPAEDWINALWQIAGGAGGQTAFRQGASPVIVLVGDASSHDPSRGHTLTDAVSALKGAAVRVLAVDVETHLGDGLDGNGDNGNGPDENGEQTHEPMQATEVTGQTGGRLFHGTHADEVADKVAEGLTNLPTVVGYQTAACDPSLSVTLDPVTRKVTSGEVAEFTETIQVADDAPQGADLYCTVEFLLDGQAPGGDEPVPFAVRSGGKRHGSGGHGSPGGAIAGAAAGAIAGTDGGRGGGLIAGAGAGVIAGGDGCSGGLIAGLAGGGIGGHDEQSGGLIAGLLGGLLGGGDGGCGSGSGGGADGGTADGGGSHGGTSDGGTVAGAIGGITSGNTVSGNTNGNTIWGNTVSGNTDGNASEGDDGGHTIDGNTVEGDVSGNTVDGTTDGNTTDGDDGGPGDEPDPAAYQEAIRITVNDMTVPVITVDDRTTEATDEDGTQIDFTATAEDGVDGDLPVTCDPESGSVFPVGTTEVTCTATDSAGNTGTATATFTVLPAPVPDEADVAVSTHIGPATSYPGRKTEARFTLTNAGPRTAKKVAISTSWPDAPGNRTLSGLSRCSKAEPCTIAAGERITVTQSATYHTALRGEVRATVTGTPRDPERADNTDAAGLRVLQPRLTVTPRVLKPGGVVVARGKDFPPGATVTLAWKPGITATRTPVRVGADGTFTAQVLVLRKDRLGHRELRAQVKGYDRLSKSVLVVQRALQPPDFAGRS